MAVIFTFNTSHSFCFFFLFFIPRLHTKGVAPPHPTRGGVARPYPRWLCRRQSSHAMRGWRPRSRPCGTGGRHSPSVVQRHHKYRTMALDATGETCTRRVSRLAPGADALPAPPASMASTTAVSLRSAGSLALSVWSCSFPPRWTMITWPWHVGLFSSPLLPAAAPAV